MPVGENELRAVGGVGGVIEVKTLAIGLIRKPDDAMAGIFVDPFLGGGCPVPGFTV